MFSAEICHIGGKLEFGPVSDLCRLLELNARVKLSSWVCQVLSQTALDRLSVLDPIYLLSGMTHVHSAA